jgi:tetratricopeptide (TPR) repeat protein
MVVYIGLSVYFYFKNKKILFWLLFFPIMLLTVLTPFRIAWTVAERYVYVGSLGIFVVVAMVFEKLARNNKIKPLVFLLFSFIIIALMVRSIYRNIDWKNQDNLWIATGITSPSDPKTHNNLGDVYARWNQLDKSAEEFKKAIQINPKYAEAWHNLANIYFRMGKIELAINTYNKALSYNPNLWQSYQTLGVVYYNIGQFDTSEKYFKKALAIFPGNPDLHSYLGILYLQMGKKDQAKQKFYDALSIDPKHQMSLNALKEILK